MKTNSDSQAMRVAMKRKTGSPSTGTRESAGNPRRGRLASATGVTVCLLLMMAGTGCHATLPSGYVMVDPQGDGRFRAVSADACALTVRSESNPQGGNLAFWEKAIVTHLIDVRGYKLVARQELDNNTAQGMQAIFDYNRDGTDYTYVLGLFVKGSSVHVFEAAGIKGKIQRDMADLTKTMQRWPL